MTIAELLDKATQFLSSKEIINARGEAEILLSHFLNLKRVDLYVNFDRPLNDNEVTLFRNAVKERLSGKPLQYITGHTQFRYLELEVREGVFIPRPETEGLVDIILNYLKITSFSPSTLHPPPSVLDIGIGSGAIALSIAKETNNVKVFGVDISPIAIEVATENAKNNGLEDKVTFVESNLFQKFKDHKFDVIVSNPPYIADGELNEVEDQVKNHEPMIALTADKGGLAIIEKIITGAKDYLYDNGLLAMEIGYMQGGRVSELARAAGFSDVRIEKDLTGKDRYLIAVLRL